MLLSGTSRLKRYPLTLLYLEVRLLIKFKQDWRSLLKFQQEVSFLLKLKVSLVGRLACMHFAPPAHPKGHWRITLLVFASNSKTCIKNSLPCVQAKHVFRMSLMAWQILVDDYFGYCTGQHTRKCYMCIQCGQRGFARPCKPGQLNGGNYFNLTNQNIYSEAGTYSGIFCKGDWRTKNGITRLLFQWWRFSD